jgi:hypothetical protein
LPTTELDPKERLLKANAVMHDFVWGNQMQMQLVLARLLDQAAGASNGRRELRRHNRRTKFIRTALAPARDRLDKSTYLKLCAALALVISTESMVVFRDVLQIEEAEVRVVEECIDLGKTTFHLVALGAAGKVLVWKFTQKQLLALTANMQSSLIGLEACAGAHFLGQALRSRATMSG